MTRLQPGLGQFRNFIKKKLSNSNFEKPFFLYGDILQDSKKCHGTASIMEHDRMAVSRIKATLSRGKYYKQRCPQLGFLEANISMCSKFCDIHPFLSF